MKNSELAKSEKRLRKWGLHSYPKNFDPSIHTDDQWAQRVCRYIQKMPRKTMIAYSGGGCGELRLAVFKNKVLVFDNLDSFTNYDKPVKPELKKDIQDPIDECCRVLVFDWRNVKRVLKGKDHGSDKYFETTFLIEMNEEKDHYYRFVMGDRIEDFVFKERVKSFYCHDLDGTPFSYAVTAKKLYLFDYNQMFERKIFPKDMNFREGFSKWYWENYDKIETLCKKIKSVKDIYNRPNGVQIVILSKKVPLQKQKVLSIMK